MPKPGDINHVPGVYRSVCCGVERSMPDNFKLPPCPGSGNKSGESRCAGQPLCPYIPPDLQYLSTF